MKRKDTAHTRTIRGKQKSVPVQKTTVQRGNYIPRKPDKRKKRDPFSTQNSIPYKAMYRDGICHTKDGRFSKTIRFYDINYQLAQNEDKTSIFESWCDFLNYFDVRKGPGTSYGVVMTLPKGGGYTIIEESGGWGKLKSGAGWISLKYTEKL